MAALSTIQKIYSSRCWIDNKLQPATICIADGKINDIFFEKIVDARDMGEAVIMPGVIDAHVHVNEPGRTDWEGFSTATMAAAAGGTTTIIDMPLNASPVTTTLAAFREKLRSTEGKLHINVGFYGGLIPGNYGHLQELIDAGVVGIKCFLTHSGIEEFPNVEIKDVEAAMPLIAANGIPLLAHCEISEASADIISGDPASYNRYLSSRPKKWENDAVEMMIALCRKYDCKTHIVHVSSDETLPKIKAAKAAGVMLTAETCPHYILFNSETIPDGDTLYKCAPPIREAKNNQALKLALAEGTLDFIATDHSPAPPDIKQIENGNFEKGWGGISGLQFLLPSAYTAMKSVVPLEKFIPLLTSRPAKFLAVNDRKGYLKTGYDADIVIWQPETIYEVKEEEILHRHKNTPYVGKQLQGEILHTIVNGVPVYSDKQIIFKNAGKWLLRK